MLYTTNTTIKRVTIPTPTVLSFENAITRPVMPIGDEGVAVIVVVILLIVILVSGIVVATVIGIVFAIVVVATVVNVVGVVLGTVVNTVVCNFTVVVTTSTGCVTTSWVVVGAGSCRLRMPIVKSNFFTTFSLPSRSVTTICTLYEPCMLVLVKFPV